MQAQHGHAFGRPLRAAFRQFSLKTAGRFSKSAALRCGTWLSFKKRGDLDVLVEGDKRLFNQYCVMIVSPEKHPHVKAAEARRFVDWVTLPSASR